MQSVAIESMARSTWYNDIWEVCDLRILSMVFTGYSSGLGNKIDHHDITEVLKSVV